MLNIFLNLNNKNIELVDEVINFKNSMSFSSNLNLNQSLLILLSSLIAGLIMKKLFTKYSLSLSSKTSFGNTLLLILTSVSALIAVVKTSLALSLGLVGALSVIRYRTAIKDPYSLAFLLSSITVGIAIGADQIIFGILFLLLTSTIVYWNYKKSIYSKTNKNALDLESLDTLCLELPSNANLIKIENIIKKKTNIYKLISIDQSEDDFLRITIRLNIESIKYIEELKSLIYKDYKYAKLFYYNSENE